MRNSTDVQTLLDAQGETGVGNKFFVEDYRNVVLFTVTDNSAGLTVTVRGSIQEDSPDFSASSTKTNLHETIQIKDLSDGSTVDGDTGYVASADETRAFEVNTNGMRWITVEVSAHSAGDVSVYGKAYDNR